MPQCCPGTVTIGLWDISVATNTVKVLTTVEMVSRLSVAFTHAPAASAFPPFHAQLRLCVVGLCGDGVFASSLHPGVLVLLHALMFYDNNRNRHANVALRPVYLL